MCIYDIKVAFAMFSSCKNKDTIAYSRIIDMGVPYIPPILLVVAHNNGKYYVSIHMDDLSTLHDIPDFLVLIDGIRHRYSAGYQTAKDAIYAGNLAAGALIGAIMKVGITKIQHDGTQDSIFVDLANRSRKAIIKCLEDVEKNPEKYMPIEFIVNADKDDPYSGPEFAAFANRAKQKTALASVNQYSDNEKWGSF